MELENTKTLANIKLNPGESIKTKLAATADEFLTKAVPAGMTATVSVTITWRLEGF